MKKCATEARETLRDSLTPLRKVQANIAGADNKKLAGTEAQVDSQKEKVCNSVRQSFRQLKAVLEQRETELVKKSADSGPREGGCSDGSEEGSPNGPDRNPEPGGVCRTERGEHKRRRSDEHPLTTAVQG